MESISSGVGTQMLGGVFGAGIAVAAVYWETRRRRLEREERRERPPMRQKLMRPAGYSCACRAEALSEKTAWCSMALVAAGMVLGIAGFATLSSVRNLYVENVGVGQLLADARTTMVIGLPVLALMGGLLLAHCLRALRRLGKEHAALLLGLRGEQAVAEALSTPELGAAGYNVFHDVPAEVRGKVFNVDHVVVGPGGVFVLETKTRARRAAKNGQPEHEMIFDGERLQFPWCEDRNAVKQVQANVDWLRNGLKDFGGEKLTFHPVIVVPGWYVRTTRGNPAVKAMNEEYLVKHFIVPAKRVHTPDELRPVVARLAERCRTLEL